MEANNSNLELQLRVLEEALNKGLIRNEEQRQFWTKYKSEHEKVTEALSSFVQGLKVNCMVPLGSKALVKGSLIHTNEVLVSIGDGYFVKYSVHSALELCGRRIKHADEMLQNLDKERDLLEMRKILPIEEEVFNKDQTKEINEFWEQREVDDWKTKHREREKEYRQKLADVRKKEAKKIETEEDLFERLDQLELEEELEDELNRQSIDVISDDDSSNTDASGSELEEEIQRELEKLKELRSKQSEKVPEAVEKVEECNGKAELLLKAIQVPEETVEVAKVVSKRKRVSFSDVKEEHSDQDSDDVEEEESMKIVFSHSDVKSKVSIISSDVNKTSDNKTESLQSCISESRTNKDSNTNSSTSKINVNEPKMISDDRSDSKIADSEMDDSKVSEINSPADIYRVFNSHKPILKRRAGDVHVFSTAAGVKGTIEEEEEPVQAEDLPRPVSKFRRERMLRQQKDEK